MQTSMTRTLGRQALRGTSPVLHSELLPLLTVFEFPRKCAFRDTEPIYYTGSTPVRKQHISEGVLLFVMFSWMALCLRAGVGLGRPGWPLPRHPI